MPATTAAMSWLADYDVVGRAIAFISARRRERLSFDAVAEGASLSCRRLEQALERWAGLTPEAFLRAVSVGHARDLLCASATALDALSASAGASIQAALAPGDPQRALLVMRYGFHPSPFGEAILVLADDALAGLGFVDAGDREAALADMVRRWPGARLLENSQAASAAAAVVFDPLHHSSETPLNLAMIGSDFDRRVWETLLRVPAGRATTYSDVAQTLGVPRAPRSVGAAVGRNPISFVVPCHRVLGRSGALTGYHWGLVRKQAMILWEAGRTGFAMSVQRAHFASGRNCPNRG